MLTLHPRNCVLLPMTAVFCESPKLSYWTDSSGTVLRVAGRWDSWLKQEGDVPDRCLEANVVGNSLFSFIESDGVRHVYRVIHARSLETGRTFEFPYRCDGPWIRREMQMKISRDGNVIRYDSVVLAENRRERPLPWPVPHAATLVAMCSFCKAYRFPVESPLWKDLELIFEERKIPDAFSVTHGLCPACEDLFSW